MRTLFDEDEVPHANLHADRPFTSLTFKYMCKPKAVTALALTPEPVMPPSGCPVCVAWPGLSSSTQGLVLGFLQRKHANRQTVPSKSVHHIEQGETDGWSGRCLTAGLGSGCLCRRQPLFRVLNSAKPCAQQSPSLQPLKHCRLLSSCAKPCTPAETFLRSSQRLGAVSQERRQQTPALLLHALLSLKEEDTI